MTPDRGGKSYLIEILMSLGYSRRKAIKAINAVFDIWADALRRGEPIELPGGIARTWTRKKAIYRFTRLTDRFHNTTVKERKAYRLVKRPAAITHIRFTPDKSFDI